jgi:hypothetical protein
VEQDDQEANAGRPKGGRKTGHLIGSSAGRPAKLAGYGPDGPDAKAC